MTGNSRRRGVQMRDLRHFSIAAVFALVIAVTAAVPSVNATDDSADGYPAAPSPEVAQHAALVQTPDAPPTQV